MLVYLSKRGVEEDRDLCHSHGQRLGKGHPVGLSEGHLRKETARRPLPLSNLLRIHLKVGVPCCLGLVLADTGQRPVLNWSSSSVTLLRVEALLYQNLTGLVGSFP